MRLLLVTVTMIVTLPIFAETLSEAVQHSLISNPEVIFNSTKDLSLAEGVHKARGAYNTTLDLNASYSRSRTDTLETAEKNTVNTAKSKPVGQAKFSEPNNLFNQLKFNQNEEPRLKTPGVASDLALGVVSQYLSVMLQEKLVNYAQVNLRLNRSVFLTVKQQKGLKKNNRVALDKVAAQVAKAESNLLRAQARLHQAKKNYAKVVGKWPSKLVWPLIPANSDLPSSVGQAIEQGLDNYPTEAFANTTEVHYKNPGLVSFPENKKNYQIKNRSIIDLSKTVRISWDEWTTTGLKLNTLRKRLVAANLTRDTNQEKFKAGKGTWLNFLKSQKTFYQAQIAYECGENAEIVARYRILNSIGKLLPFINTNVSENLSSNEIGSSFKTTILPEMDLASYPYPDYKPRFRDELVNAMEITALASAKSHINKTASVSAHAWFVSAGNFKSRANAVALANRLKGLGFIVFMETLPTGSSVLIGPYEYRGHAVIGLERLKDIAHVQGILVTSKQERYYG